MVIVFTGNGKGKTTASIGQAVRAIGQGKKVAMFQFIKSHGYPSGEDTAVKKLGKNFKFVKGGKGFVGIMGDKLPRKVHKDAARKTLEMAEKAIVSKKFDMIILDEINVALYLKLISKKQALNVLRKTPKNIDLILTGRNAPPEFIKIADLATSFEEIKHPFQKGVSARKSIEY